MARFLLASAALLALAACLAAAPGESRAAACASVAGLDSDSGLGGTGLDDPDSGIGGTGIAETDSGVGGTGIDDPDSGVGGTGIAGTDSGVGGTGIAGTDSGVGGTGIAGTDSGVGGTGIDDPDSGIGGTGIFGTITGFASVCINGLEVEYDENVPVTDNGEPASASDLAVGQVVWIIATDHGDNLVATSISMLSAVIGTVEKVDAEAGTFRVDGEDVQVPPSTLALGEKDGLIQPGARVDVSGLRRPDGRVIASRIERAGPEARRAAMPSVGILLGTMPAVRNLSVQGFAGTRAGDHHFSLDGIEVEASLELPRSAGAGLRVTVKGPVQGKVLRAERMKIERLMPQHPERSPTSDLRPVPKSLVPEKPSESHGFGSRPAVSPRSDAAVRPEVVRPEIPRLDMKIGPVKPGS
jgi:hypothetical protein